MATFSISDAAESQVRHRLASSGLVNAVASLLDSSGPLPTSPEIFAAITRKASEEEMFEIAKREYAQLAGKLNFRLNVGIYTEDRCRPEDLVLIGGLQFAIPKEMREYLKGCVLDYVDGDFLLRNGDKTYVRLQDLGK